MSSAIAYTLRHFRRKTQAVFENIAWHEFFAENDEQAIIEAGRRIAESFDERTDYVPLWRGTCLIWERGGRI